MKENDVWDIIDRPSDDSKGQKNKVIDSNGFLKLRVTQKVPSKKKQIGYKRIKDNSYKKHMHQFQDNQ